MLGRSHVANFTLGPRGAETPARKCMYMSVHRCRQYWEHVVPVSWPDINLLHGWHFNPNRVPVLQVPVIGHARLAEIHHRRAQLPADLRDDSAYTLNSMC